MCLRLKPRRKNISKHLLKFEMVGKRIIITLFFLYSIQLYAQSNYFMIGVEGGPSRTFLRGNAISDGHDSPISTYSTGISCRYYLTKTVSLKTVCYMKEKVPKHI